MNTILITGANRGIGLEMAKQYSQDGWQVLACCRKISNVNNLQELAHSTNNQVKIFQLDVVDDKSVHALAQQIKDTPVDILMNNAGVYGPQEATFGSVSNVAIAWLNVFNINAISPLRIAEAFLKNVTNSRVKIIANMSSAMGSITENAEGKNYIYRSSKAALNAVTKSLALDLQPHGVTVVSLHPGWVQTDMGGPNALLDVQTSVQGIKKVLSTLSLKDTGNFLRYDGAAIAW